MHRTMTRITVALAAFFIGALTLSAQPVQEDRNFLDSWKGTFTKEGRSFWKPELTIRQEGLFGYAPELISLGIRLNQKHAIGLGAGHNEFRGTRSIPFHIYNRRYYPLGKKEKPRFFLYSDILLGYEYIYHVYEGEDTVYKTTYKKGDGTFNWSLQAGIALRLWGKSNLFLGPSIYGGFNSPYPMAGLHLGFTL